MIINPFRLLEIEPILDLNLSVLDQHYFKKQRAVHPDRVRDPVEKKKMEQQSTAYNVAYGQLKNVGQRARALLDYYAYPFDQHKPDSLFLMAFFEWQENKENHPNFIKDKKIEVWEQLKKAFETHDLNQAACYVEQWQYLEKY